MSYDYNKETELYYEAVSRGKEAVARFMDERLSDPDFDWMLVAVNIDDEEDDE